MSLLDLSLLGLLADQPMHGYELSKRLRDLGRGAVSFGALYPALGRLDRKGLISSANAAMDDAIPMTGSLGAEVARLRRAPAGSAGRSGRKRKVYTITEAGRRELGELLVTDAEDDRGFGIRVAFATHLTPAERLALFQRRRDSIDARLATDMPGLLDRYRRALRERDRLADEAELVWLDELIAHESDHPSEVDTTVGNPPIPQTVGGSPT